MYSSVLTAEKTTSASASTASNSSQPWADTLSSVRKGWALLTVRLSSMTDSNGRCKAYLVTS